MAAAFFFDDIVNAYLQYKSERTGRGPLQNGWVGKVDPVMTCYKAVRINFDYWGVQGKVQCQQVELGWRHPTSSNEVMMVAGQVEKIIRDQQRELFHTTLRQVRVWCMRLNCENISRLTWLIASLVWQQAQCLTDQWFGLTMEDIRRLEADVVAKLQAKRLASSSNNQ